MELSKYPKTQYEMISSRFGLEGTEPDYIIRNLGREFPDCSILVLAVNLTYPPEIIVGGELLNRRILKAIDDVLGEMNLYLTQLSHYPLVDIHNSSHILPLRKCETINDSEWYVLVDQEGGKTGEFKYWTIDAFMGEFYGEDAAIFIVLPKDRNIKFRELLEKKCMEENIQFRGYPDVKKMSGKIKNSFLRRLFRI